MQQPFSALSWRVYPCVRLVLPLMAGIVAYELFPEGICWWNLSVAALLVALGAGWFWKVPSFRVVRTWGSLSQLLLVGLGWLLCWGHDARQVPHALAATTEAQTYSLTLESVPQLKGSTLRARARVEQQWIGERDRPCSGQVLLTFPIDTLSVALRYGDQLLVHATIREISPPQNPQAFDAQAYYGHQNIYHRAYIPGGQWQTTGWAGATWRQQLYRLRAYLLQTLNTHLPTPNEYAVGAALLLGAKETLSTDLRNAYADTGAMHVLAVSGLHVGILIGLLALCLRFLERRGPRGKRLRALLLLLALWGYALLTGASASVLRASTMFSFILLGQLWGRRIQLYNALGASALLLLLFDPFMLFGVGFQLSYTALLGIVYFYPKIYASWQPSHRLVNWLWNGLALSLAAQLGTAPLSVYYFHQFPLYFWLSGVVVMAVASLLLGTGLVLLLLQGVPLLGTLLGLGLYALLRLTNTLIFGIQQLPGAVWEGLWWNIGQLFLAYALVWTVYQAWQRRRLGWALLPLCGGLAWLGLDVGRYYEQQKRMELCLYHNYTGGFMSWVNGATCTTLGDSSWQYNPRRTFVQQNYLCALGVEEQQYYPWQAEVFLPRFHYTQHCAQVEGQRLAVVAPTHLRQATLTPLAVDYLWLQKQNRLYDLAALDELYDYQHLIFDASNPAYRRAEWADACRQRGIKYTDLAEEGALILSL